jgi:hypothetical protein
MARIYERTNAAAAPAPAWRGNFDMRRTIAVKAIVVSLAIQIFCSLALAQDTSKRGPSTADERKRFLQVARKMAESPLDPSLSADRDWALKWLIAVPDITVDVCNAPFSGFMSSGYKYTPQIIGQLTFATAVFIIEHPDKSNDRGAQYVAGTEGALQAYQAILKTKPDATERQLNDLLEKQKKGTLAAYVRASCQGDEQE